MIVSYSPTCQYICSPLLPRTFIDSWHCRGPCNWRNYRSYYYYYYWAESSGSRSAVPLPDTWYLIIITIVVVIIIIFNHHYHYQCPTLTYCSTVCPNRTFSVMADYDTRDKLMPSITRITNRAIISYCISNFKRVKRASIALAKRCNVVRHARIVWKRRKLGVGSRNFHGSDW